MYDLYVLIINVFLIRNNNLKCVSHVKLEQNQKNIQSLMIDVCSLGYAIMKGLMHFGICSRLITVN